MILKRKVSGLHEICVINVLIQLVLFLLRKLFDTFYSYQVSMSLVARDTEAFLTLLELSQLNLTTVIFWQMA